MLDDDVWGSDSEGEGRRHLASELGHEWQARQNQFHTLGYRDGVEAGKNSSVQEGFNFGYGEATVAGFNWGVARGLTSAFAALPAAVKEKLVGESEARGRFETLDSSIHSYASTDALRSFYRDLNTTPEAGLSGSDAVQGSRNVEGFKTLTLASQAEGVLDSRDEPVVVSMVGLNRLPESHAAGVWEADHRDETEQIRVPSQNAMDGDCSSIETRSIQEHVGHCENDKSSSFPSSAAGKSELEELEKKVRSEFVVASVKICDVLIGA